MRFLCTWYETVGEKVQIFGDKLNCNITNRFLYLKQSHRPLSPFCIMVPGVCEETGVVMYQWRACFSLKCACLDCVQPICPS